MQFESTFEATIGNVKLSTGAGAGALIHVSLPKEVKDELLKDLKEYCSSLLESKSNSNSNSNSKRLTTFEYNVCKAVGAKYVSRNQNSSFVSLWDDKPFVFEDAISKEVQCVHFVSGGATVIAKIRANLFPSVKANDLICVDGEEKEGRF